MIYDAKNDIRNDISNAVNCMLLLSEFLDTEQDVERRATFQAAIDRINEYISERFTELCKVHVQEMRFIRSVKEQNSEDMEDYSEIPF